jgi:hypothetical protein
LEGRGRHIDEMIMIRKYGGYEKVKIKTGAL